MSTIALIDSITTAPLDGSRMPTAYKKTDAELKAELPHIFALLRTTLTATIIGTKTSNHILSLPTKPAQIHSFCNVMSADELHTEDLALAVRRMVTLHEPHNADNLIQHLMQHQKNGAALSQEQLRSYLETYIEAVGNDYKRIFSLNRFVQGL